MEFVFDYENQPGRVNHNRYNIGEVCKSVPLVSVITPFFNAGEDFEQAFHCMQNQTFPWFEWIIIDDGSTCEEDVILLKKFAGKDARIQLIQKENEGPAAARNFGAARAKTDYYMFFDADDLLEPPFLETLYLALQQEKEASWAYTDIVTIGENKFLWQNYFSSEHMKKENLLTVMALIRAKDFWRVGGFDVMGRFFNEDWHLWLKLLAQKKKPVHIPILLAWYRKKENGAMAELNRDPVLVEKNKKIINEAAQAVPSDIEAIRHRGEKQDFFTDTFPWKPAKQLPFAKEKVRILLLLPHMVMGGADKFNLDFISGLNPHDFEVSIVTTLPNENDWRQRFSFLLDDIFVLPYMFDKTQWPAFLDYMVHTRKIDIVFNTNSYYSYYAIPWLHLRYPHLPFIDYIHMEEWYYRHGGFARPSGAIGAFLDKTYVCNERTRQVLIENFGREPQSVKTVYIGVDEKEFDPAFVSQESTLNLLLSKHSELPVVLFPCRICTQKRPFLMLEIAKRLPEYLFVVVGDGPQLAELQEASEKEGLEDTVLFVGRQNNMKPWYKKAAVTLICSLKEGLSLTAYESLSMETPVVTSDVGGQAELVNETVGRVVPLLQSESADADNRNFSEEEINLYVEAVRDIIHASNLDAMKRQCRQRILDGFTVSAMREQMAAEILGLVSETLVVERKKAMITFAPIASLCASYVDSLGNFEELDTVCMYHSNIISNEFPPLQNAKNELDRIYLMRSYKVAQLYQRIVQNSFLGSVRQLVGRLRRWRRGEAVEQSPPKNIVETDVATLNKEREFDFASEPGKKSLPGDIRKARREDARISVISAFYNSGAHFEQTYQCVMEQSFPWFEWIIVNDGSTNPKDVQLLETLAATDERITVIHKENSGLSAARNTAIENCNTDIFVPLDTDDLIEPTYLEYTYFSLMAEPQAAWAYTDCIEFGGHQYLWKKPFSNDMMCRENLLTATAAIHKKVYESIGGYKVETQSFNEDWCFWLKALQKGYFPAHISSYQFWYRRSEEGMLANIQTNAEKNAFSRDLIEKLTLQVPRETRKIEFPISCVRDETRQLSCVRDETRQHFSDLFKNHAIQKKKTILLVFHELCTMDIDGVVQYIAAQMQKKTRVVLVVETLAEAVVAQQFRRLLRDFYSLAEFLSPEDWPEFVHYLIATRQPQMALCEQSAVSVSDSAKKLLFFQPFPAPQALKWIAEEREDEVQ